MSSESTPKAKLLSQIFDGGFTRSYALIHRPWKSPDTVEVVIGDEVTLSNFDDLDGILATTNKNYKLTALLAAPYNQISDRGLEAVDDGAKIIAIVADIHERIESMKYGHLFRSRI